MALPTRACAQAHRALLSAGSAARPRRMRGGSRQPYPYPYSAAHLSGHMWNAAKEMSLPECCATKSWPTPPALRARRASGHARACAHA